MEVASFLLVSSSVVFGALISILFWCREHIDHCFFCNIEIKKKGSACLFLCLFLPWTVVVDTLLSYLTEDNLIVH